MSDFYYSSRDCVVRDTVEQIISFASGKPTSIFFRDLDHSWVVKSGDYNKVISRRTHGFLGCDLLSKVTLEAKWINSAWYPC